MDLIVATPELDGVTPALGFSSTLLIEKSPDLDVFVSDYHWRRKSPQRDWIGEQEGAPGEEFILRPREPGAVTTPARPAGEGGTVRHPRPLRPEGDP